MNLRFFNVREVAALLRISEISLRRLIKCKKIPYRKIGSRRIIFADEDIQNFLSASVVPIEEEEQHENS